VTHIQEHKPPHARQLLSLAYFWSVLRTPETFTLSLIVLAAILSLGSLIPQQPPALTGDRDFAAWLTDQPALYQALIPILRPIGLFQVFESTWFWLPVAWFLFVCLVTAADYLPFLNRLSRKNPSVSAGDLGPSHPFKDQTATSRLVPAPSDAGKSAASSLPLAQVQTQLEAEAYHTILNQEQQTLTATRHQRRWWGPMLIIIGIIFILAGSVIQALWGHRQTFELPLKGNNVAYLGTDPISIRSFTPQSDTFARLVGGQAVVDIGEVKNRQWQLHRPYRHQQWWLILAGLRPNIRIDLAQSNQSAETMGPQFENTLHPASFTTADGRLGFELHYMFTSSEPDYRLQLTHWPGQSDRSPEVAPKVIREGSTFTVPSLGLQGRAIVDQKIQMRAYQLPGLWPGLIGLLTIIGGLAWLAGPPPVILWVSMVTKGRGSRLEVEVVGLNTVSPDQDHLSVLETLTLSETVDD